jgi:hypothetical protein
VAEHSREGRRRLTRLSRVTVQRGLALISRESLRVAVFSTLLALAVLLAGCGASHQRPTPSSSPCVAMCLAPISVRPLDPVPPIIVRPLFSVHRPTPAPHRTQRHHHPAPTLHRVASST